MAAGGEGGYPYHRTLPQGRGREYPYPQTPAGGGGGYPKSQISAEQGYPDPYIPAGGGGYPNPQISPGGIVGGYPDPHTPAGRGGEYLKSKIPAELGQGYPDPHIPPGGGGYPNPQIPPGGIVGGYHDPQIPGGGYRYPQTHEEQMMVERYKNIASSLVIWLNSAMNWIVQNGVPTALMEIKAMLRNIARFRAEDVPTWYNAKMEIFRIYDYLQNCGVSLLITDESSIAPRQINLLWNQLEFALLAQQGTLETEIDRVLCIRRRAGHLRTDVDNNATLKPPPGPSENKVLMTAQCQQLSDGDKMVETSSALQHVQLCFQLIVTKHALLEGAVYGNDINTVKQALDQHEKVHEEIINLKTEVDKCLTDRKKLTLEEQQPYEKYLSLVELMYPVLHKLSHQRREWLVSLQEFLHKATGEMVWIEEKQVLLCEFGQRVDEFSISDEQMYKLTTLQGGTKLRGYLQRYKITRLQGYKLTYEVTR